MLKAFADCGWTVVGVERSVQAIRLARDHFGLPVFVGELGALWRDAQFDLLISSLNSASYVTMPGMARRLMVGSWTRRPRRTFVARW
jgi:hypothetical protein